MSDETRGRVWGARAAMIAAKRAYFQGRGSYDLMRWAVEQYRDALRDYSEATGNKLHVPHASQLMR